MLASSRKRVLAMRPENEALIPSLLVTLNAFAVACLSSTYVYLIEQAVCRQHFMIYDQGKISSAGLVDEESCKIPDIQAHVASINGVFTFLAFLPAFFFTGPYRQLAKALGRKMIIFMNICGFAIDSCFFITVCYCYDVFDIRWIYLAPFLYVIGGGTVIFQSLLYTYISEGIDSKHLSGVLYKLRAAQLFASFLGMGLSSYLLRKNVWLQCAIGIGTLLTMVPFTALLHDSLPTPKEKPVEDAWIDSDAESSSTGDISNGGTETDSLLTKAAPRPKTSVLGSVGHALVDNLTHTVTLFKEIVHGSSFTRITMLTYFLLTMACGIDVTFPQWSSLAFSFILAEVNAIIALSTLVSFIVLLSLPAISSILRPHFSNSPSKVDLFVTKASVIAMLVGNGCMALATTRTLLIPTVIFSNFGSGVYDALRSFVTGFVASKDEIEQLYLGIGLVETTGSMLGTVVWSGALREVVGRGQMMLRLPYGAYAVFMLVVFSCVVVLGRVGRSLTRVRTEV